MKTLLAFLAFVATTPAGAKGISSNDTPPDRYAGYYTRPCGSFLQCDLRISSAGRDKWRVRFDVADRRDPEVKSVCSFRATAAIGTAKVADMEVSGIAVGQVRGKPFGIFDLGDGRVNWSSTWDACPGIAPKGIYGAVGD